jgi:hypothetical protein
VEGTAIRVVKVLAVCNTAYGKEHDENRSAVNHMPFCSNLWLQRIAVIKEEVFPSEVFFF